MMVCGSIPMEVENDFHFLPFGSECTSRLIAIFLGFHHHHHSQMETISKLRVGDIHTLCHFHSAIIHELQCEDFTLPLLNFSIGPRLMFNAKIQSKLFFCMYFSRFNLFFATCCSLKSKQSFASIHNFSALVPSTRRFASVYRSEN